MQTDQSKRDILIHYVLILALYIYLKLSDLSLYCAGQVTVASYHCGVSVNINP